ncbi:MAG: hypothetical protein P1V97_22820 [Planctomycetota bacterium]|nr:hypothetical protein [Planctomycetota bacterium]
MSQRIGLKPSIVLGLSSALAFLFAPGISEAKTVHIERTVQSTDGEFVISCEGSYGSGQRDVSPILVKGKDGKVIQSLTGFQDIVYALAVSSDNTMVAAAAESVFIWDLKSGRLLQKCAPGQGLTIDAIALSPNNCVLAVHRSSERRIHYWDLPSGQKIKSIHDQKIPTYLRALSFAKQSKSLSFTTHDSKPKVQVVIPWPFSSQGSLSLTGKRKDKVIWTQLLGKDYEKSYQLLERLAKTPNSTLAFIKRSLPQVFPVVPPESFQDLLTRLDSDDYEKREFASRKLTNWKYFKALQSLDLSQRSIESRYRITKILVTEFPFPAKTTEALQLARCLQLLEKINSQEALKILKTIPTARPQRTAQRMQLSKNRPKN